MNPMRWVASIAAILLVGTSACSSVLPGRPGSDPPTFDPDPGQVVFQVRGGVGGLAPANYYLGSRPTVTIYGNGDAYVVRETVDHRSYPGRPIAFVKGTVPGATLRDLVRDAARSGLFDGADYGEVQITDVGDTSVTFRPDRRPARRVSVYALDIDSADDSLAPHQRLNRQALRVLEHRLADSVVTPDAQEPAPWPPTRVDVTAPHPGGSDADDPAAPWPGPALDRLLTSHQRGRCGVLSGRDAQRVYLAARQHGTTHWREGTTDRTLVIRALLPGEAGCGR